MARTNSTTQPIIIPNDILAIQALGSPFKTLPVGFSLRDVVSATFTMTSQRVYFQATYIYQPMAINGVYWYQVVNGAFTATNNNKVGLYSYASNSLTLVASSANDNNLWQQGAAAWNSKAFSAQYNAAKGLYFIGYIYSGGATVPTLGGQVSVSGNNVYLGGTAGNKHFGFIGSLTDLPAGPQAMSGISLTTGIQPIMILY